MKDINELKDQVNTKTINFILLTLATAGIYFIIWLNENHKKIDRITNSKTADHNYIVWLAVCSGLGGLLSSTGEEITTTIGVILSIAYLVLCVIWAFRAKVALQEYCLNNFKIDLRMNSFYVFIFTAYYINYCINDLPEAHRKQQILNSHQNN